LFHNRKYLPYRKRAAPPDFVPPTVSKFGRLPFTEKDRDVLGAWLSEGGWSRRSMDIVTLEGFLVGLLVWPVSLPSAVWLPSIWGERGWRAPAKIASREGFERFVALVVGFLQELDRGISECPPHFVPKLPTCRQFGRNESPPICTWARGFLAALEINSQGLQGRTSAARAAVEAIARRASTPPALSADLWAIQDLSAAVLMLAAERSSRGPLGVFEIKNPNLIVPASETARISSAARTTKRGRPRRSSPAPLEAVADSRTTMSSK